MAVHFCEVEHKTAVVSMNKMCEKPPRSATDILLMPSLFCFVPEKAPDGSEWLRWICLDCSHHLLEGLPSLETPSGGHKIRLFP